MVGIQIGTDAYATIELKETNGKWTTDERGWELIINIVSGIMPQTIQSGFFFIPIASWKDTIRRMNWNISTFYICIYSNWNFFSDNDFHLSCRISTLSPSPSLSHSLVCFQDWFIQIRFANKQEIWEMHVKYQKNIHNFQFILDMNWMHLFDINGFTNLKPYYNFRLFFNIWTCRPIRRKKFQFEYKLLISEWEIKCSHFCSIIVMHCHSWQHNHLQKTSDRFRISPIEISDCNRNLLLLNADAAP